MPNNDRQAQTGEALRSDSGEGLNRISSKFLRIFKRELSMPAFPTSNCSGASASIERPLNPRLTAVRSVDHTDHIRRAIATDRPSDFQSLAPGATKHSSLLFSQRKSRFHRKHCGEDETTLQNLRSEDSAADEAEPGGLASSQNDDSSRRLNILWEDDPGSKSGMFLSLLNIENDEVNPTD